MTKEELKIWLSNKIDSCYYVKHLDIPDNIFLYYDEQLIRKMKLSKLKNEEYKQDKINGICLFHIDNNSDNFYFDCDISIWTFIKDNYSNDYNDIQELINDIINTKKYEKIRCNNILNAYAEPLDNFYLLSNIENLYVL